MDEKKELNKIIDDKTKISTVDMSGILANVSMSLGDDNLELSIDKNKPFMSAFCEQIGKHHQEAWETITLKDYHGNITDLILKLIKE